jgi:hypothetical protein
MAVEPQKLIAAISADTYCDDKNLTGDEISELKEKLTNLIEKPSEAPKIKNRKDAVKWVVKEELKLKEPDPYLKATDFVKLKEFDFMDFDEVIKTPFKELGIKNPIEQHTLSYDTSGQALEQVYYWLHDYLQTNKEDYGNVEKLLDNFISAPGSAHFSEMGMKAAKMQEEGMKILGVANQLIKSILNIVYDMKEFKLRLDIYKDYHDEKDKNKSEASYLSLKQIWLDQVDIKRGNSSIKALAVSGANAPNFVLLIDAFMAVKSLQEIQKMDLNERVKRLLEQRFSEFERWLKESERELKKRYEIEKLYLKSQVNTVKLYARWAKPYLKAAAQLEQRATATSSLVTAFNTSLFELTLLGMGEYDPIKDYKKGELPKVFIGKNKRKYVPVVLVELKFRSIPERFQQGGYGFRGKADITFTSFALNAEEREVLKNQLDWDDFKDVYTIIGGATEEGLGQLQTDLDELLGEKEEKEEKKKESSEDTNAFAALFSIFTDVFKKSAEAKKEAKEKTLAIAPDSNIERIMRSQAGILARFRCSKLYGAFKKLNNSPTI